MLVSRTNVPTSLPSFGLYVWAGMEEGTPTYTAPITLDNAPAIAGSPLEEWGGLLPRSVPKIYPEEKRSMEGQGRWESIF